MNTTLITIALILLFGLLLAEYKDSMIGKLATKPFLSICFVYIAFAFSDHSQTFTQAIVIGLLLSLIGDVFLIFSKSKRMFLFGLISFLSAHIAYLVAFYQIAIPGIEAGLFSLTAIIIGVFIFRWLNPYLGTMRVPVIAYMFIISGMVMLGSAVYFNLEINQTLRTTLLVAAILFYISDICVARDRFVANGIINRLFGLPLYYLAQFLFAASIGMIDMI